MLKPMPVSAIKAEVFATSKVKKKAATNATKPRTALLHEIQNDVTVASPKTVSVHSGSDSTIAAHVFEDDQILPFSKFELKCKGRLENLSIQFGSFSHISRHDTLPSENMHAAGKVEVLVASIDNDSSKELTEPETFFNGGTDDVAKNSAIAILENSCTNTNILAGTSVKLHGTRLGCPAADMEGNGPIMVDAIKCTSTNNGADSRINEAIDNNSKPRTALFQGGENDEPMAGQINSGSNSLNENNDSIISSSNNLKDRCFIKFGAFSVDVKQMLKAGNIDSMVTLPAKLIFQGDNFLKKIEATKQRRFIKSGYVSSRENIEKPRKYIFIGLMQVEIIEETPS